MTVSASGRRSQIGGVEVTLDFGDVPREYGALRAGAMLVDRSHRGRMRFRGAKAREVLTGLVTNDVLGLVPGDGCYACALTAKGRIVTDLRALATADGALVDVPTRAASSFRELVRKFVNPRLARYEDVSATVAQLGVFGARALEITSAVTGVASEVLESLRPYSFVEWRSVLVMRTVELGLPGWELFIDRTAGEGVGVEDLWTRFVEAGATPAGLDAWEIARVEAGRPEWGLDMDESTLVQEVHMDELHAISYTKGCYTGQEVVARVHFRGHVNRHLRALRHRFPEPIPPGTELHGAEDRVVGEVRSSLISPRLGAIALGMVRRELELPATVMARWGDRHCDVDVYPLPFPL
jgi:tRNA-modifying protein YgfZ